MSNITEDELTEAINILCGFAKDHNKDGRRPIDHPRHCYVGTRVKEALKYIDKAIPTRTFRE